MIVFYHDTKWGKFGMSIMKLKKGKVENFIDGFECEKYWEITVVAEMLFICYHDISFQIIQTCFICLFEYMVVYMLSRQFFIYTKCSLPPREWEQYNRWFPI